MLVVACTRPIAGKPAPTLTAPTARPVQYLWELACRRLGCAAAPYATAAFAALPRRTQASNTAAISTKPR